MLDAIRTILQGKVYVSGESLPTNCFIGASSAKSWRGVTQIDSLSDRELEAFQLDRAGMTTESIAEKLDARQPQNRGDISSAHQGETGAKQYV